MHTHGDIPCPRKDFSVTSLDGKVVVQGGVDYDGNVLDDMYALDPHTGMWTTMYRSDYTVCMVHCPNPIFLLPSWCSSASCPRSWAGKLPGITPGMAAPRFRQVVVAYTCGQ